VSDYYSERVRGVLDELRPHHHDSRMWDHAIGMSVDERKQLLKIAKELAFIVKYVEELPE
jgi:hypothetical protein